MKVFFKIHIIVLDKKKNPQQPANAFVHPNGRGRDHEHAEWRCTGVCCSAFRWALCIDTHRAQRCLLSRHLEMGERAGNGRPFGVIIVEVPGDINAVGGPGDIWEVIMELYPFVYAWLLLTEPRRSIFLTYELSLLDLESVAVLSPPPPLTLGCPIPLWQMK